MWRCRADFKPARGAQLCLHTYFVNLYLVINCLSAPRSHMFHVLKETPRFNELVLCFLSFLLDTSDDDDADDDKTRSWDIYIIDTIMLMMISIFWFFKNSNSNFILCLKSGNVVPGWLDHVMWSDYLSSSSWKREGVEFWKHVTLHHVASRVKLFGHTWERFYVYVWKCSPYQTAIILSFLA